MKIVIPMEGRALSVLRSSSLSAQKQEDGCYELTGDDFHMGGLLPEAVLLLPDTAELSEGDELTDEMISSALSIDDYLASSAEESSADALGVLLRIAAADGKLTNAELLRLQPALARRIWQPGLEVQVGDLYYRYGRLWKCLQTHTTKLTRLPELSPLYWQKVDTKEDGAEK